MSDNDPDLVIELVSETDQQSQQQDLKTKTFHFGVGGEQLEQIEEYEPEPDEY